MALLRLLDLLPDWVARAIHDLGVAAWFGGAYMGAVALNGASMEVDDHTQRNRVANAGWFRWAAILPVALAMHGAGVVALSRRADRATAPAQRAGVAARTGATVLALAVTAVSGRAGRAVAAAGDVPTATAVRPIEATPEEVARAQGILRVAQWVIPAATAAVIVADAWQQHHGGTRAWLPPVMRG